MAAVVGNTVVGNLTGMTGNATAATNLTLSINLNTGLSPQDNSPNLSTGTGLGRFENGWIRLGTAAVLTGGLYGNGNTFVRHPAGFAIPAEIIDGANTIPVGQVIGLSGSVFTVAKKEGLRAGATGRSITGSYPLSKETCW